MHISWLGGTALKLVFRPAEEDIVVVIDPYKPELGSFPRNLSADLGLYTRGEKDTINIGEAFVLSTPGECEVKGVLATGVYGSENNRLMFRLDSEQLSIGHLGLATKQLTERQIELLNGVDILFVPIGDEDCYDPETAAKVANYLEAKVIIPIAMKSDNNPKAKGTEDFLKEMGAKAEPEKKIIIKKKTLPEEGTVVMLLAKE
jgi:L-ascorbate metabolism protein UlaG (beta-lactamase superfamily)